jgi:predicted glycoside hydrolase/deacetylase ChbG (UPF0249 family)
MKRLIVNADDLGADKARNAGIFETIDAGVVTSASILPNGPALEDALSRLRSLDPTRISFGLHLNLSEGTPLSYRLRLLTGPDGAFLGKARAQQLLMHQGDQTLEKEVADEMVAQVRVLRDAGIRIQHLDGHQHVHVFPAVIRVAIAAAKEHRIPWMRIPEEPLPPYFSSHGSLLEEGRLFSGLARLARLRLDDSGIQSTDSFKGLYLKGRLSLSLLQKLVDEISDGLTEFMVHPGRVPTTPSPGPFASFSTPDRERELEVLLDRGFMIALQKTGVVLTPFPEARG